MKSIVNFVTMWQLLLLAFFAALSAALPSQLEQSQYSDHGHGYDAPRRSFLDSTHSNSTWIHFGTDSSFTVDTKSRRAEASSKAKGVFAHFMVSPSITTRPYYPGIFPIIPILIQYYVGRSRTEMETESMGRRHSPSTGSTYRRVCAELCK
jgi:hypothetical protein